MTILARIEKPGYELTVCGTPSKEWLEWLKTTTLPLTEGQLAWRELVLRHRESDVAGDTTEAGQ